MPYKEYRQLLVFDTGRTKYKQTWEIQKRLVEYKKKDILPDCLIVAEHYPVITMGRGASYKNLLVTSDELQRKGIELFEIERGGDITFHGPGQTVLYPVVDLNNRRRDTHRYLRDLENFAIKALSELGLRAGVKRGMTGIWVQNEKIGAIGVAVSGWITYHGIAINISTDLNYFKLIVPCGIPECRVSSLAEILGRNINMDDINQVLINAFAEYFNYRIESCKDPEQLPSYRTLT